ncbi:hypothetical protein BDZ45DRAFT_805353 [Acephala macrosclerotiorum]|nr:hypothetical protein BDZ45DRAFT_805353 [Acephala macrosclerotiorum]
MLFWESRNLKYDGFSWAPSTFLSRRGTRLTQGFPSASHDYHQWLSIWNSENPDATHVDDKGFRVKFPGTLFDVSSYTKRTDKVQMHVENLDARYCACLVANKKSSDPTWNLFVGLKGPAIILPRELPRSQPVDRPNMILGTLVDVLDPFEEVNGELCRVYETLVICFGLNWEWKPTPNTLNEGKGELVKATALKDQEGVLDKCRVDGKSPSVWLRSSRHSTAKRGSLAKIHA